MQSCNTAQVVFSNTSLGADTYQWTFPQGNPAFSTAAQPQVTYLSSGNYNAQLIAANSGGSDTTSTSFYVKILAFPVANFTSIDLPASTAVQFGFTGSGALFYTWNFGDGSAISNEESPIHVFPAGGVYQVRLLIQNECGASILEQVITVVNENVAVTPISHAHNIVLYPNPSVDGFWLTNVTLPIAVNVMDMNGRIMRQLTVFKDLTTYIDATGLAAGTYFVQAIFADGQGILRWVKTE